MHLKVDILLRNVGRLYFSLQQVLRLQRRTVAFHKVQTAWGHFCRTTLFEITFCKMSAPTDNASDSDKHVLPSQSFQWYGQLDSMIGEKKNRSIIFSPPRGIPQAERTREEIRIQSFFESCSFKTGMSCAMGRYALALTLCL